MAQAMKTAEEMNAERRATKRAKTTKKVADSFRTCKCPDGAYRKLLVVTEQTMTYDAQGRIRVNGEVAHSRAQTDVRYLEHRDSLCVTHVKDKLLLGFVINGVFEGL